MLAQTLLLLSLLAFVENPSLQVRTVTDEADAVLMLLEKISAGETISEQEWQRLYQTEGYSRLKEREAGMKRPFTEEAFREFVHSADLQKRRRLLKETLQRWKEADLTAAANRALAYLPEGTVLKATVFPVIKPQTNSFVFDLANKPSIFLYIDPDVTSDQFENTVAHELHHIGLSAACLSVKTDHTFPKNIQDARDWLGSFGEGVAMLAAAGGPNIHPHAVSKPEDRARWDKDMASFAADLGEVEKFFFDLTEGRLTDEQASEKAFSFFGVQGPWYTVGYGMAVSIERAFGRSVLIDSLCKPVQLLENYNRSAENGAKRWSPELIKKLKGER